MNFKKPNNIVNLPNQSEEKDTLDMCFMIDCTGSMQPYIDMARDKIKQVIKKVKSQYPNSEIKTAIVAYRDVKDKKRFEVFPFSESVDEARNFLDNLKADGGNDIPEDVNGGFQKALYSLNWTADSKMLYHIADAPCHGRAFHDNADDFPKGHKDDKPWDELLGEIRKREINYIFFKISSETDKMFAKFLKIFNKAGEGEADSIFKQEDIGLGDYMKSYEPYDSLLERESYVKERVLKGAVDLSMRSAPLRPYPTGRMHSFSFRGVEAPNMDSGSKWVESTSKSAVSAIMRSRNKKTLSLSKDYSHI